MWKDHSKKNKIKNAITQQAIFAQIHIHSWAQFRPSVSLRSAFFCWLLGLVGWSHQQEAKKMRRFFYKKHFHHLSSINFDSFYFFHFHFITFYYYVDLITFFFTQKKNTQIPNQSWIPIYCMTRLDVLIRATHTHIYSPNANQPCMHEYSRTSTLLMIIMKWYSEMTEWHSISTHASHFC